MLRFIKELRDEIFMPKESQRVALSKRLLKEAVMELLRKKHISKLSVSEVCERAEINRTTFYRHYQTPHDILLEIELDFVKQFYEAPIVSVKAADMQKYAAYMCSLLYDNRETLKVFIRNNTGSDFTKLFQSFADSFLATRKILYKGVAVDADTLRLMNTYFAHGIYALVRQWIIEDINKSPEDIADLIVNSLNRDISFQ